MAIQDRETWEEMVELTEHAEETLTNPGLGVGSHQRLIGILRREHGIRVQSREEAILEMKKLIGRYAVDNGLCGSGRFGKRR